MFEEAKEKALAFLLRRVRSEYEVRKFLQEKDYDAVEDDVIDFLYEYAYLDDEAFAGMYIRDKIRFAPCGTDKLRYELQERGVESFIIDAALEENFDFEKEVEVACDLLQKRQRGETNREKLKRYLYGKGFSNDVIYESLRLLYLT